MSDIPKYEHDDEAVKNYINDLFKLTSIPQQSQLILMAGIALNDVKLIKYACDLDPTVVKRPVPQSILEATDAVLGKAAGCKLSAHVDAAAAEGIANPTPSQMVWADNNASPN